MGILKLPIRRVTGLVTALGHRNGEAHKTDLQKRIGMIEWTKWAGGRCPLNGTITVEVQLRNGELATAKAGEYDWRHIGSGEDIMFYRLVQADKHEKPQSQPQVSALGVQVGGSHYKDNTIQPVEFIHANNIPFIEGNCIKYLVRWRSKGGVKDLEKVKHYVDLLIELETRSGVDTGIKS